MNGERRHPDGQSWRVLLVDDDEDDYVMTRDLLAEIDGARYELDWAASYEAGLAAICRRAHDLYLLDYRLGAHDGLQLLRAALAAGCRAPLILLTGQGERAVDVEAMRAGAMDYLVKGQMDAPALERSIRYAVARWQSEEALRASEERYRELFENANDMLYTCDLAGRFTSINRAGERVTGFTRDELLRMNFAALTSPEQLDEVGWRADREVAGAELEIRRKDGRRAELEVGARLIYDAGRAVGVQGSARDVTERKHLEDQLRLAQKMEAVGRLAGGVAHDFNNLLTAIIGFSQLLLKRLGPDNAGRREIEEIKRAGERAASLTRQLLAFSRRQVLQPKVLDLNAAVTEMEHMLRRLIHENVDLRVVLDPGPIRVKADPGQLEQVIMNLVLNARDAMPGGGKLTVETASAELGEEAAGQRAAVRAGRYVVLAVSDTGVGMDAATQARVFEPFFTTKEQGKGTGLGLATVYGIVRQSGGHIRVESAPGRGATFRVFLPLVEEGLPPAKPPTVSGPLLGTETVLIVEDEPSVRALAGEALRACGYTVLEASDGGEALLLCQGYKDPIHLVVTDVVMPQLGGRELARRLATLRPEVKVLYMSGYADDGAAEAGAAFLQKPFMPDDLARKVRETLAEPR
jgi:two-component system, cell cycle sensor histidine kinase and response regulator CckA